MWNEVGMSTYRTPEVNQKVVVKRVQKFKYDNREYDCDPEYFVAEYYNGRWLPCNDHLSVDAGWDGGTIACDFKDEDIVAWKEI